MSEEREQRNQVFSQPPSGVDPRIQAQTSADRMRSDFGYEIPVAAVPLPSLGKVYSTDHPLHLKETVDVRGMTAREEDILTSKALLKKGTVISELIKSCLTNKQIDPTNMLIGDRSALMVAIRITGYGENYDAEIECNECQVKSNQTFNLAELPLRSLEIEPSEPNANVFEFVLPTTKKTVKFKFMTGRDEEDILAMQEKQKKLGLSSDTAVSTNLLYSIVSIDGNTDRAKIGTFVRMMPARDSLALRTYIKDNEPGIIMKQEVSCPSCGHSETVMMPIHTGFLWPAAK